MPTSTVPAVWTALHSLIEGLGLTITRGTQTLDIPTSFGAPMVEDGLSFIGVGYRDDGSAVNGDIEWAGLGRLAQDENYGLSCLIYMTSGDSDMTTRVTEAYTALNAITTALAADYRLGGACHIAQVARQSLTPIQSKGGAAALLEFTVAVTARIV